MSSALMAQREALQQAKLMLAALKQSKQSKSPPPSIKENPSTSQPKQYPVRKDHDTPKLTQPAPSQLRQSPDPNLAQDRGSPEYKLYPNPYKQAQSLAFQKSVPQSSSAAGDKKPGAVLAFTPLKKVNADLGGQSTNNGEPSQQVRRRTASSRRARDARNQSYQDQTQSPGDTSKDVYSLEEIVSNQPQDQVRTAGNDDTDEYIYSMDNEESLQQLPGSTPGRRSGQRSPKGGIPGQPRTPSDSKKSAERNNSTGIPIKMMKTSAPSEATGHLQQPKGHVKPAPRIVPTQPQDAIPREVSPVLNTSKATEMESSFSTRNLGRKSAAVPVQSAYSMSNLLKPKKHTHDDDYWLIKQQIKKTEAAYKLPNSPEVKLLEATFNNSHIQEPKHLQRNRPNSQSQGAKETGSRESEQNRKEQLEMLKSTLRNKRSSHSQPTILGISHDKPIPLSRSKQKNNEQKKKVVCLTLNLDRNDSLINRISH